MSGIKEIRPSKREERKERGGEGKQRDEKRTWKREEQALKGKGCAATRCTTAMQCDRGEGAKKHKVKSKAETEGKKQRQPGKND